MRHKTDDDNYSNALRFVPDSYKTQKCVISCRTYLNAIKLVLLCYKTQEMYDKLILVFCNSVID